MTGTAYAGCRRGSWGQGALAEGKVDGWAVADVSRAASGLGARNDRGTGKRQVTGDRRLRWWSSTWLRVTCRAARAGSLAKSFDYRGAVVISL
jgi:hypothetical protein